MGVCSIAKLIVIVSFEIDMLVGIFSIEVGAIVGCGFGSSAPVVEATFESSDEYSDEYSVESSVESSVVGATVASDVELDSVLFTGRLLSIVVSRLLMARVFDRWLLLLSSRTEVAGWDAVSSPFDVEPPMYFKLIRKS